MHKWIGLLMLGTLLLGCDSQSGVSPDLQDTPDLTTLLTAEERAVLEAEGIDAGKTGFTFNEAPVLTFADEDRVGFSRTVRLDNGILGTISTSQLEPGTATTLWMVVFNAPDQCTEGICDADDVSRPEARVDLVYVDGGIVGPSGRLRYFWFREVGDESGSIADALFGNPEMGVEDAHAAEVHYVVRSHGPVIEGFEYEMTHTFNGCCTLGSLPDDPRLGPVGPNTCANVQFAVHKP